MAIKVPSADKAQMKYVSRASVAGSDYATNAAEAAQRYVEGAQKGEANYKAAVAKAAAEGRYGAGIRAKGSAKYADRVTRVGAGRFTEGVAVGQAEYGSAISKVLSTIASVTLPDRGPVGSPGNINRVAPIGVALRRAFGKEK